jgi:type III restriction enzyme
MANLEKQVRAMQGGPVLPPLLAPKVRAWAASGYEGVTAVTESLLHHWFSTEHEEASFHPAQRTAIETAIFVHEVLRRELPEGGFLHGLHAHLGASEDRDALFAPWWADPLPRYGFKLATGTGKTWVLQALLVWQVLNRLALEGPAGRQLDPAERAWREAAFSARCLVVTPGLVVHDRLLDALLGTQDARGNRQMEKADLRNFRDLFIPSEDRDAFFGAFRPLNGRDVMETTPQPEAFALVVNWQALMDRSGEEDEAEHPADLLEIPKYGSVTERGNPRYLVLREWLAQGPDLVIFNDEAHHTHTNTGGEEGVWEAALNAIRADQTALHGRSLGFRGDFSATPFFQVSTGRGKAKQASRKWFPHILCDYGLAQAQKDMLVKQLWLVKDPRMDGDAAVYRSEEGVLTDSQKALIDVGLAKRKWVEDGLRFMGVASMPKLMVVAEDTSVADQAAAFIAQQRTGEFGLLPDAVAVLHSNRKGELKKDEYEALRRRIFAADRRDDLQVIVNVAMLQEGFDVNSICVIVFLRAGESAILVEQVIGRGLRLMFRKEAWPELWPQKEQDAQNLWARREPMTALDMLYLVDHPKFRQKLREFEEEEGLAIGEGELDEARAAMGDLVTVGVDDGRVPALDLAWPLGFYRDDPPVPSVLELLKEGFKPYGDARVLAAMRTDKGVQFTKEHMATETQVPWTADLSSEAQQTLANLASALVEGRKGQGWLTDQWADMVDVVARVAKQHLFPGSDFDPLNRPEDARVLRQELVRQHLLKQLQDARDRWLGRIYESHPGEVGVTGWGWASDPESDGRTPLLRGREARRIENARCVFPAIFEAAQGGGLERAFITEVLEKSGEVLAWFKPLERRHSLALRYRTRFGELSRYWPDFAVRLGDTMWLVETKAARDRESQAIWDKAKAALAWCRTASDAAPVSQHLSGVDWSQPKAWRYAILFDDQWDRKPEAFSVLVATAEAHTLAYLRGQGELQEGSLLSQMQE